MRGDEIAAFLVGKSSARQLPDYFLNQATAPVIQFESPNFLPAAQNKRPGLWKSVFYNLLKLPVFISNMNFIRKQIKLYVDRIDLFIYASFDSNGLYRTPIYVSTSKIPFPEKVSCRTFLFEIFHSAY